MSSVCGFYIARGFCETNQDTMYVQRNMDACASVQPSLRWKSNEYHTTRRVCTVFVDLRIQHAMRMRHIVICFMPRSTIFFHISHEWHDFRGGGELNKKCVFWFSIQLLSETILILRRNWRVVIKKSMYIGRHAMYP